MQQVGEIGLVAMNYVGWSDLTTYRGLGTNTEYEFGLLRARGYVDARDAPSLLEIVEDTRWVFEVL